MIIKIQTFAQKFILRVMPVLWDLLILSIFLLVVVFYHDVIYDYSTIAYYGIIFLLFIFATLSIYIKLYIHPSAPNKISVFLGSVSLNKFTYNAMIYNTLFKQQINKLIKKFTHSIKILYCKLFNIYAHARVFNFHAKSIGTKQNLMLTKTQFHTFLKMKSMSLILRPYGLFIFSLLYSMIIRSSVAFCDFYNPLEILGDMLLSESKIEEESESDKGAINYPQPILFIADLLLSETDPQDSDSQSSGSESPSDSSQSHDLTIRDASDNSSQHDTASDTSSQNNTASDTSSQHDDSDPDVSPIQQLFNNFIPLVENIRNNNNNNLTLLDMRGFLDYVRDTIPEELWTETPAHLREDSEIAIFIDNLDNIIQLPNQSNITELIYYKTAIVTYDTLQVTDSLNNDDLLKKVFLHTIKNFSDLYFDPP